MQQTCPHCQGEGEMHDPSCKKCGGSGAVKRNKTLSKYSKRTLGIESIVWRGRRRKGGNGDLFIEIKVNRHEIFERDGKHLYCEVRKFC